jgi:hypothetical protein
MQCSYLEAFFLLRIDCVPATFVQKTYTQRPFDKTQEKFTRAVLSESI